MAADPFFTYASDFVDRFDNPRHLSVANRNELINRVRVAVKVHGEAYMVWLRKILIIRVELQRYINKHYNGILTIYTQRFGDVGFFICLSDNGDDTTFKHMHFVISYSSRNGKHNFMIKYHLVSHIQGAYLFNRISGQILKDPTKKLILNRWFNILLDDTLPNNLGKRHSKKHSKKPKRHSRKK